MKKQESRESRKPKEEKNIEGSRWDLESEGATLDLRKEWQRDKKAESRERREQNEERREKRAERPEEAARGPAMKPPEGNQPCRAPYRPLKEQRGERKREKREERREKRPQKRPPEVPK